MLHLTGGGINGYRVARFLVAGPKLLAISACGETPIDVKALKSQPKQYVGSDTCKMCHLEHYDSWKMTLHSRMMQDAKKNQDAIIVPMDEKKIRDDLAKLKNLEVPADKIFIPKVDEILYTIGSQWKQRYLVKKDDKLYIAPVQYFAKNNPWSNYNEAQWDKKTWILGCGGFHATGVDLEKNTFVEPGVGCEACHGKGSWHTALPKTAVFEKRETIVNPAKLTMGVAVQICGSCHNRGKATQHKGASWAVGYEPGKALEAYFKSVSFAAGNVKDVYANEFSKGHHQQYIDWAQSKHADEGVTCTSYHYVHQIGVPATRSQTHAAGSKQCLACHQAASNLRPLDLLGKIRLLGGLLGPASLGDYRPHAHESRGHEPHYARLGVEYPASASPGRGPAGHAVYLHPSFYHRPSAPRHVSHE